MAEKIYVVSVGTGNPDYLTAAALKYVKEAQVIAGGARNLEMFDTLGKEVFVIGNNLHELQDFLKKHFHHGPVVLASGDAGFYGILRYLKTIFSVDELQVIPGISSMQMAFAKLSDTWHDAILMSIHGRPLEEILSAIHLPKVALLTDREHSPQVLAQFLLAKGCAPKEAVVLNNLSYSNEYIWKGSLEDLAKLKKDLYNSVVVIYND